MSDLIKREDAIKAINKALDRETLLNRLVRKVVLDAIISVSSADRPQGEWIEERANDADYISWHRWKCSVCGDWQTYGTPRHCPNCGARMKGADDE